MTTGSAFDRASRARPAGWHEDPEDPGRQRWFDGSTWTDITRRPPGKRRASCRCC
ncbi:DUF2510 domain-containing protein [Curtobacterium sp. MCBD17_032]|uniref:DUF2510 domain-containing protein n=1 Tax=Curtobacterium sp. MCBD17_032 TaxID=2175659 RepID=UPI0015E8C2BB